MRAVIVNPASGSGRTARRWRRIVGEFETRGEQTDVRLTEREGDAIGLVRAAIADGIRRFVVLGGDGTVGEVVAGCVRPDGSGVLRDDLELSVIHQGTGGDLARGIGVPEDEDAAIAVALGGDVRRIDVGVAQFQPRVDGVTVLADHADDGSLVRGFSSVANVGMAAEVVQQVTGTFKRLGDKGAFAAATVGCLVGNRPRRVRVTLDSGAPIDLDMVDVDICNNRFMGGGMHVAPEAELDDGLFDVVLIAAAGRLRLLRTFPKIYSGRHVHDPLVQVYRSTSVTIESRDAAPEEGVVLDGELVGSTPVRFRVLPSAIGVRVPAGAARG